MDGLGNINWWGFSPSIDLLELLAKHSGPEQEEFNILLVNAGDARHLLHTIAFRRKHFPNTKVKLKFYVFEKMLELYARDFLLLSLAIEHPSKRGVQEKTELFLEMFGNLLVRDHTAQYIQQKANEFIKCITDFDYLAKCNLKLFDFSLLKFKERDFLEGIFKYWRLKSSQDKGNFSFRLLAKKLQIFKKTLNIQRSISCTKVLGAAFA
jgi:dynein assembly factor 3